MRQPTPEQQQVLNDRGRIRIVRAAPGSGKTWLVAEEIRRALNSWRGHAGGIAALSFTRVGGDEIRRAVGCELTSPHFVGTIDAFLFRYVVRPFLTQVFVGCKTPVLVPGEFDPHQWAHYAAGQSTTVISNGKTINVFSCVFIGEIGDESVLAYKPHPTQPLTVLKRQDREAVKEAKQNLWKRTGMMSHSDAAMCASRILTSTPFGKSICEEILRRFPFIIVDELQDTGHFLGKSLRTLIENETSHALLVGDPDQAIYEFNGARPELFDVYEQIRGAVRLPLARSLRCPSKIANAAFNVKQSITHTFSGTDQPGRAILVNYKKISEIAAIAETVRLTRPASIVKVVARAMSTIDELSGVQIKRAPSLHCRPVSHLLRAVIHFNRQKNGSALAAARAAIDTFAFGHEGVLDEDISDRAISLDTWKATAVRSLIRAVALPTTSSYLDWSLAAATVLQAEVRDSCPSIDLPHLQPQKRKGWDCPTVEYLPCTKRSLSGVEVQTVHAVKGETHDTTIFVCPPSKQTQCPSSLWWSKSQTDSEERRIAYVAMTRPCAELIICVSEDSYARLKDTRSTFVSCFECVSAGHFQDFYGQQ